MYGSEEECELNTIEGAVNIPLNELRERLGELPKGRPVVVFCAVGLRGYIAARILMQRGYEVYNLSGGLKTYKAVTVRQSNEILPETLQKEQSRSGGGGRHLTVDACGLQCPGPVMKLKSEMEGLKIGERLEITATDPGFVRDVGSWAKNDRQSVGAGGTGKRNHYGYPGKRRRRTGRREGWCFR